MVSRRRASCVMLPTVSPRLSVRDRILYSKLRCAGHFIFGTFASAFLLKVQFCLYHSIMLSPYLRNCLTVIKLLKPEFSSLITKDQEEDIFELIGRLIRTLNSPEIAIDDRHTPRLHARFLAGLLSKHRRDVATTGRLHAQPPSATGTTRCGPECAWQWSTDLLGQRHDRVKFLAIPRQSTVYTPGKRHPNRAGVRN